MLISIIIPVYNTEKYLRKCVNSIINQSYKKLEIILVDDGSPDGCGSICDEYAHKDGRIKVIHKKNGGVSSARNEALDIATGEYVGFVDSDDYIESDMYFRLYNNLIKYDADVSVCSFMQLSVDGNKLNKSEEKRFINVHDNITGIKNICTSTMYEGHLCNKLFKRNLFENKRLDVSVKVLEDSLICLNAFLDAKTIVYDSTPLYNYVRHEGSVCSRGFTEAKYTAHYAFENMRKLIKDKYIDLIKYINLNELRYSTHLLNLLYNSDVSNKNYYLKQIGKNMRNAFSKGTISLIDSKTVMLCTLLNIIHIRLAFAVFTMKKLVGRNYV